MRANDGKEPPRRRRDFSDVTVDLPPGEHRTAHLRRRTAIEPFDAAFVSLTPLKESLS